MQAYLGDYPGSRDNSDIKFMRAVQSFIDQSNKNSELIIISDGCEITHRLYFEHYKSNDRVKYAYVDKDTPKMYEYKDGGRYYRGFPRQIGLEMASGDVIAYMDSDDFIIKDATNIIVKEWEKALKVKDFKWALVNSWVDHSSLNENSIKEFNGSKMFKISKTMEIPGLPSMWSVIEATHPSFTTTATWAITHVKDVDKVKWKDVYNEKFGKTEDYVFHKNLESRFPGKDYGFTFKGRYYVRLHSNDEAGGNIWDY